jgi:hypothetical protein
VINEGDDRFHIDIGDSVKICWRCQRHGNGMTNWHVSIQAPTATGSPLPTTITTEKDAETVGIPLHERMSYLRVDKAKGNNAPPAKAVWRRFINVDLPNGDEVGVITPWDYPGQGEMVETNQKAEHVYLTILDRMTLAGRTVNARGGPNFAPHAFAKEPEALLAKVSKAALAAAQIRLFAAGKIRMEEYGSGNHRVRRIALVVKRNSAPRLGEGGGVPPPFLGGTLLPEPEGRVSRGIRGHYPMGISPHSPIVLPSHQACANCSRRRWIVAEQLLDLFVADRTYIAT